MESSVTADAEVPVAGFAAEVLRLHVPDPAGWCAGCLAVWRRMVPHPCPQAEWAAAVLDGDGGGATATENG